MIRAFISYSHADENYRNELQKHLMSLQHQGLVETWHDRCIAAGEEWAGCIDNELRRADIILLLISVDFIASRYCYELEMKEALSRHDSGEAVVIPVILRPCNWTALPFGKLQASTREGKAVSKYPNWDDAFLEITQNIEVIAKRLNKTTVTPLTVSPSAKPQVTSKISELPRSANLAIPKTFSDYDKDTFVTEAFNYIALFFEGSLDELEKRNDGITTRFKKVDTCSFEAVIYRDGKQVSQCGIWLGNSFGSRGASSITYSNSGLGQKSSFNESMSVKDNGNMLGLEPMGMGQQRNDKKPLTNEGAAEYYWSMFFEPVQRLT